MDLFFTAFGKWLKIKEETSLSAESFSIDK